jgi:DNA-binding transcriptional LysR family regulator
MELRQLEYLVAVAEEASFTRAAGRVHISQSGVSAQVRQLEHELGAELIDRSGRAATPTPAGAAALIHAKEALAAAAALRQAVDEVNGLLRGQLTVGMVTACTITALFDALDGFHRAHPAVALALIEACSAELVERVRAGTLDLALIGAAGNPPDGLAALPIVTERVVAAVPPAHELSGRTSLTLRDLVGQQLICMPPGTGIRSAFDRSCAARNVAPAVTVEASAAATIADLAARGLGVAILSQSMAAAFAGDPENSLRAVPIEDAETQAILALVWRPSPAPAVVELLRHCRQAFGLTGTVIVGGQP